MKTDNISWLIRILMCVFSLLESAATVAFLVNEQNKRKVRKVCSESVLFIILSLIFCAAAYLKVFLLTLIAVIPFFIYVKGTGDNDSVKKWYMPLLLGAALTGLSFCLMRGSEISGKLSNYPVHRKDYFQVLYTVSLTHVYILFLFLFAHLDDYQRRLLLPITCFLGMNSVSVMAMGMITLRFLEITIPADLKIFSLLFITSWMVSLLSMPLYLSLMQKMRKIEELDMLYHVKTTQKARYTDIRGLYRSYLEIRHDMNHFTQKVNEYLVNQKTEELERYVKDSDLIIKPLVDTECEAVDAAISMRAYLLNRKKINFSYSLCNLYQIPIEETDLASVIMNLLDNAETAVLSMTTMDNNYIRLDISHCEQMLVVQCINSVDAGNTLKTKKQPGSGLGRKIIGEIAEKYNGVYTVRKLNDSYTAIISFPWREV